MAHLERCIVQGGQKKWQQRPHLCRRSNSCGSIGPEVCTVCLPSVPPSIKSCSPWRTTMRLTVSRINYDFPLAPAFLTAKLAYSRARRCPAYSGLPVCSLRSDHARASAGSREHARRRRFRPAPQLEQGSLGGAHAGSEAALDSYQCVPNVGFKPPR